MITVKPDEAGLAFAVEALRKNEVVACPTETVYGLAVNPFSEKALEALFNVKGRDRGKAVLVLISDPSQLQGIVTEVSSRAEKCMKAFWPGPLSLLLPAKPGLPKMLTGGREKICVRCTSSPVAQQLCRLWSGPLTSTSANLSGEPPALEPGLAALPGVSVLIDGGVLTESEPSTVYDPDEDLLLRPGPIGVEVISNVRAR